MPRRPISTVIAAATLAIGSAISLAQANETVSASIVITDARAAVENVFVVRAADLPTLNFGAKIGVVAGSPSERALVDYLGDGADVAAVTLLEFAENGRLAMLTGRLDSLYMPAPDARRYIAEATSALAIYRPTSELDNVAEAVEDGSNEG